jgi:hypothetical protein
MKKLLVTLICAAILTFSTVANATYYMNEASSHKGYVEAYVDYPLQLFWLELGAKRINSNLIIIPNNVWNAHIYDEEFTRLSLLLPYGDKYDKLEYHFTVYYYRQRMLHPKHKKYYAQELKKKLALIESNRNAEEAAKHNDWRQQLAEQRSRARRGGDAGAWYYGGNGSKYLKDVPSNGYYYDNYGYPYYGNGRVYRYYR